MKNTLKLVETVFWLVAFWTLAATASQAQTTPDCCGSGEEVYRPSTQHIKIINSPEVNKQLAVLKDRAAELAKTRKAINVSNKLIQGHVNHDLYQYGWDDSPADSVLKEAGWQKHFGPMVAVNLKEFRAFIKERDRNEGFNGNQYIANARYLHLLCPYSQLASIKTVDNKLYLTYRFVHVARPNTKVSHMLDRSMIDISKNGKIQTKTVVLNADLKLLPYDKADSDWWNTTGDTIPQYKEELRFRKRTNFGFAKDKLNLQELLDQIKEAEKVCNEVNPFR